MQILTTIATFSLLSSPLMAAELAELASSELDARWDAIVEQQEQRWPRHIVFAPEIPLLKPFGSVRRDGINFKPIDWVYLENDSVTFLGDWTYCYCKFRCCGPCPYCINKLKLEVITQRRELPADSNASHFFFSSVDNVNWIDVRESKPRLDVDELFSQAAQLVSNNAPPTSHSNDVVKLDGNRVRLLATPKTPFWQQVLTLQFLRSIEFGDSWVGYRFIAQEKRRSPNLPDTVNSK